MAFIAALRHARFTQAAAHSELTLPFKKLSTMGTTSAGRSRALAGATALERAEDFFPGRERDDILTLLLR